MPVKIDEASQYHSEFLASEVNRLINSARNRIEQQRIHIRELARHSTECAKARHDLKLMRAAYRTLRAHQDRWQPGGGERPRFPPDASASKLGEEEET
jgi:uncharacterized protein YyaL (SSP411 family)